MNPKRSFRKIVTSAEEPVIYKVDRELQYDEVLEKRVDQLIQEKKARMYVESKYFDIEKCSDEFKAMIRDEKTLPGEGDEVGVLEGFRGGLIVPKMDSDEFKELQRLSNKLKTKSVQEEKISNQLLIELKA